MYGLQEHEMRFYCLFKKVYFSLLATSDFFCRHASAYPHMRIIRHETDMAASTWPSLVLIGSSYILIVNASNQIYIGAGLVQEHSAEC